ncbi:MAG: AraC family transcriptional regulator ligand-binding domain-containing protein [Ideonella sp.]|nr:AraC family transcriptional regulator ligand-binding domain-containing protein [Ideonella sp.]
MPPSSPQALPAPTPAPVPPIYARLLRMLLQHADVDGDQVLATAGLDWPGLLQREAGLTLATVTRLVDAAVAATGRPWLGLDLGSQAPVSAHGPMGYAAVTAPTLGHTLTVLGRYASLRNDTLHWAVAAGPHGLRLHATEQVDWGPARGVMMDTMAAAFLRLVEAAVGHLPAGVTVSLPGPRPAWVAQYQRFAPVAWRFEQAALAVEATASALALPVLGADTTAHAAACRDCEQALAQHAPPSLSQQVAAHLARVEHGRYPSLVAVAGLLGLSPRTLMRRLAAEATSFQTLLDQTRQTQALCMLQHTQWPVDEIAARLGYADTSNFSRTVRRWWGQTPSELRAAQPPKEGSAAST